MENNSYLAHFGIKGMRWGVRHDPDRLGTRKSKSTQKKQVHPTSRYARYDKQGKRKKAEQMSMKDLELSTKRINAESNYKEALARNKSLKTSSQIAKPFVRAGATFVALYGGATIANKLSNGAVFSDKNRNMEWALGASFVAALSALDIRATAPSPTPSPKPDLNQQKIDELNRRFRVDG